MVQFFLTSILLAAAGLTSGTPHGSRHVGYVGKPKDSRATWVHPGILHTEDDLLRMRTKVLAKDEPWYSAYNTFNVNAQSGLSYAMQGPAAVITRQSNPYDWTGMNQFITDGRAAIQLALQYYITENTNYAILCQKILDGWSSTLKVANGTEIILGASLAGMNFVNAAEILRYNYAAWPAANIQAFETMIRDILYPAALPLATTSYPWSGGWGTTPEKAITAYGVFLEDSTIYNQGISLYESTAPCGNLTFMIKSTGQYIESGRDQGHTQLSEGNMAELSQIAYSQGDSSVYEYLSQRLRLGYEYTTEYQVNGTVPYDSNWVCCGCETFGYDVISPTDRYQYRPIREIAYAYYSSVAGASMPYTKQLINYVGTETTNPSGADNDNAEWGTLRFRKVATL